MDFREIFHESIASLLRNPLRSALTMLGIGWGLVTVVLLLSYGQSLGSSVLGAFLGIGNNVIMAWPGQTSMQAGGQRAGKRVEFKYEDVQYVRESAPVLRAVSAEADSGLSFKFGNRVVNVSTKAIQLPYSTMRKLQMDQGRYFEASDFSDHRNVVIFGPHAAKKVFGGLPPVGQTVSIEGHPFDVIGVLQNKIQDSSNNGPDNENAFIPFEDLRDLTNQRDPDMIVFAPLAPELHFKAIEAVRAALAERHGFNPRDEKALNTWDTIEDSKQILQFSFALEVLLGIIGAMTLGVGGVGVVNIMLVSVTERTREIGLMKALGAQRGEILRQFLVESLVLIFAAGAAGMIAAVLLALVIPPMPLYSDAFKTAHHEGDITLVASPVVMLVSFAILAAVGVISGLLPAVRASRMDPVVALRHE